MSDAPQLVTDTSGVKLYHADWRALVSVLPRVNMVCIDAPYSERTHGGHDGGVGKLDRRTLSYEFWTPDDVRECVAALSPLCDGWFVTLTDHVLGPAWEEELRRAGRYVFAPLPYISVGSRVRMRGDGPSNWTTWIYVARPKLMEYARWGTMPGAYGDLGTAGEGYSGAYVLPAGMKEEKPVVGGKDSWIAHRLLDDYSRPGDLVLDPCCGGGTVGVAAIRAGRRAILGDINREHVDIAAQWLRVPWGPPPGNGRKQELAEGQSDLFAVLREP